MIQSRIMKKRVLVGMSGGVDSSVTAALLQRRGYDVIGITMQLLPKEQEKQSACCNLDAVCDAQRVAGKLGIPHYVINIRDTFKAKVIDYFVDQYVSGYTPNPCVECNRHIKFDEIRRVGIEMGTEYVATGHYVRRVFNPRTRQFTLRKAKDMGKDQSYFLYMLSAENLAKTIFPLGDFHKSEVRQMAESMGLLNAQKPDSQEICFVTKGTYKQFVEEQLGSVPVLGGPIVDLEGTILGQHDGIHHFTIGQRKGIGISSPERLYVVRISPFNRQVTVGPKGALKSSTVQLHTTSLINSAESVIGKSFSMKMRYQMVPFEIVIQSWEEGRAQIECQVPQEFTSPGQSGVIYEGTRVVGGGVIA